LGRIKKKGKTFGGVARKKPNFRNEILNFATPYKKMTFSKTKKQKNNYITSPPFVM
jgi:hypothetical protein